MSKIVLPDGSPANKSQGIVGPGGETLSGGIPENAPRSLIIPVLFVNKLSNEVEYSGAAIVPLKDFVEISKKGEVAIEQVYTEIFLQIFASELKQNNQEKLNELGTAQELYRYLVANYHVQVLPTIGANTILALNFAEEEQGDDNDSTVSGQDSSE